ncbi:cell division ATP-binding protein FtsE [Lachnospiraceae bacterium NSJ-143]|nr:cell division ATP-binding protein FtsE [Lachnospiraceae bacterium NSJ-143]
MITIKNVSKVYPNGSQAVKDISLQIDKGEFVFIIGSSGSGKSTLIKMLMKELDPSSGQIIINGINTTKMSRSQIPFLRRNLGIVFQDFRLLPKKTVYENVAFAMRVTEASSRHIARNVPTVLSLVGLQNKSRAYPNELSGGEQQRTALARAIVNNPPILIADEPTGNLDPETAWDIMYLLDEINKRGTTVVVATHASDIVDEMQKRVVMLNHGNIVRDVERGGYFDEA